MKKLLLALFLVFTLPLSAEEQPAVPTADEQAAALINAQEWFRLEACYPEIRDELSPFVRLLCEASLGSHFNRLPESCNAIGTLLNDYQQELFADPEGSMLGWLLSMLIGNLQELGAYEQAADLLTQFAAGQSEEERASTLATQRWFQTMARHPRTSLTKPDGEIRLPLTVGRPHSDTISSFSVMFSLSFLFSIPLSVFIGFLCLFPCPLPAGQWCGSVLRAPQSCGKRQNWCRQARAGPYRRGSRAPEAPSG